MCLMGRRSLLSPLRHSRWNSAAAAALGGPVVAGDDGLTPTKGRDRRAGYGAGPGVARHPDTPAVGATDVGEPARPDLKPDPADLLTPQAVANGYAAAWVGDQLRLSHHPCRNVVRINGPTSALVSWHIRTHRCGTPESVWHVRGEPAQPPRRDPTTPAHLARRRGARA